MKAGLYRFSRREIPEFPESNKQAEDMQDAAARDNDLLMALNQFCEGIHCPRVTALS